MHLEHAELAFHEQDPRLGRRRGAQRQVGDPLDRQPGCHLDDQGVIAFHRRVAAGPGGRAEIGGELPPQARDRQVDPQLDAGHRDRLLAAGALTQRPRNACRGPRAAAG
jgi:hypothetical protein